MTPLFKLLTNGLIDYAGLFPPAALGMIDAIASYARARRSGYANMLARFVVPAARLDEFAAAIEILPETQSSVWQLSALISADHVRDIEHIQHFNQEHASVAHVDCVEVKAASAAEIATLAQLIGDSLPSPQVFVEIDPQHALREHVAALHASGLYAKLRTGGVTADAFPDAAHVIDFIAACVQHEVPFKATAGLHHLLCGSYRLTYAPASPSAPMFGFLNMLLATALLQRDPLAQRGPALKLLRSRELNTFHIQDAQICWQDYCFAEADLQRLRTDGMRSFGSCSFCEPCHELSAFVGS